MNGKAELLNFRHKKSATPDQGKWHLTLQLVHTIGLEVVFNTELYLPYRLVKNF
jgi:hypothetical protein